MKLLRRLDACAEAREWIGNRDAETAWNECERADWMFWLLGRLGIDRRVIVRAAVACVQPAVTAHVAAGEDRPQQALDAALRWADDPTTEHLEAVREARKAAAAAYAASAADAAAYAAATYAAATYAAYAAYADAYAAAAVANAVANAVAARGREARAESLRRSAAILREVIPFAAVLAATSTPAPEHIP